MKALLSIGILAIPLITNASSNPESCEPKMLSSVSESWMVKEIDTLPLGSKGFYYLSNERIRAVSVSMMKGHSIEINGLPVVSGIKTDQFLLSHTADASCDYWTGSSVSQ